MFRRCKSCEGISGEKYWIIIDEDGNESGREHMTIVSYLWIESVVYQDIFLDLVHFIDFTDMTLKNELILFSHHNLKVKRIRGQGYDEAS